MNPILTIVGLCLTLVDKVFQRCGIEYLLLYIFLYVINAIDYLQAYCSTHQNIVDMLLALVALFLRGIKIITNILQPWLLADENIVAKRLLLLLVVHLLKRIKNRVEAINTPISPRYPPTTSRFLLLPAELRLQIYMEVNRGLQAIQVHLWEDFIICRSVLCPCRTFCLLSSRLPNIHGHVVGSRYYRSETILMTSVCRRMYYEVYHELDFRTMFIFNRPIPFCMFINMLDSARRQNIQRVQFQLDQRFFKRLGHTPCSMTRVAILLPLNLRKLPNLRVLRLEVALARDPASKPANDKWLAQGLYQLLRNVRVAHTVSVSMAPPMHFVDEFEDIANWEWPSHGQKHFATTVFSFLRYPLKPILPPVQLAEGMRPKFKLHVRRIK